MQQVPRPPLLLGLISMSCQLLTSPLLLSLVICSDSSRVKMDLFLGQYIRIWPHPSSKIKHPATSRDLADF